MERNLRKTRTGKVVSDKMDLVCGIATPSAMALYNACYERKIPVIFNAVSDPVQAKLAKSATEAMPGISGISDALPVAQQLKLIRLLPQPLLHMNFRLH